jgi:hypothetical protein
MKSGEVQWRLLRAERRALDGPKFTSPAVVLARTLDRMRKLLLDQAAQRDWTPPMFYGYAIEHCQERVKKLLQQVSMPELAVALKKLKTVRFKVAEEQVLNACWRIFRSTDSEADSGLAVYKEIESMIKKQLAQGKKKAELPWEATVYGILNRLDIPTKQGKRGPARYTRHKKKTSRKRR